MVTPRIGGELIEIMGDIHASLLKAEKDVRFAGKRLKDMIDYVEEYDDDYVEEDDDD